MPLPQCIGTVFIEKTDLEIAEGIFWELLKDAGVQGIFGKEQGEKLLDSVQTVYRLRNNNQKEMDESYP